MKLVIKTVSNTYIDLGKIVTMRQDVMDGKILIKCQLMDNPVVLDLRRCKWGIRLHTKLTNKYGTEDKHSYQIKVETEDAEGIEFKKLLDKWRAYRNGNKDILPTNK